MQSGVVDLGGPVDLRVTLLCGQAFRWKKVAWPGKADVPFAFQGVIGSRAFVVGQEHPGSHTILVMWEGDEFPAVALRSVRAYFSPDDDIDAIERHLAQKDSVMEKAVAYSKGLRILTQDPWECLCSYILSLNKNIPAISHSIGLIANGCGLGAGMGESSFPSAEVLAAETPLSLGRHRCGFRARYLHDAAVRVASGEVDLVAIGSMPTDQARLELLKIVGVGSKVADCVLLFAYHRTEVFPVDVWVARAISHLYMGGRAVSPKEARVFGKTYFGPFAGYAQEHLFRWMREGGEKAQVQDTAPL